MPLTIMPFLPNWRNSPPHVRPHFPRGSRLVARLAPHRAAAGVYAHGSGKKVPARPPGLRPNRYTPADREKGADSRITIPIVPLYLRLLGVSILDCQFGMEAASRFRVAPIWQAEKVRRNAIAKQPADHRLQGMAAKQVIALNAGFGLGGTGFASGARNSRRMPSVHAW